MGLLLIARSVERQMDHFSINAGIGECNAEEKIIFENWQTLYECECACNCVNVCVCWQNVTHILDKKKKIYTNDKINVPTFSPHLIFRLVICECVRVCTSVCLYFIMLPHALCACIGVWRYMPQTLVGRISSVLLCARKLLWYWCTRKILNVFFLVVSCF